MVDELHRQYGTPHFKLSTVTDLLPDCKVCLLFINYWDFFWSLIFLGIRHNAHNHVDKICPGVNSATVALDSPHLASILFLHVPEIGGRNANNAAGKPSACISMQ